MIKIFSGSAHPKLSQEVSSLLGVPLSKSEVTRFDNSEVKVTIKENVKDATCFIIQPTSNPTDTHLMELFFFVDALKRNGAKEIIAIIPYFGYARQNR
ncbi:MAG: ribose-phosphate pyrophosphokinase-like domain-containing protein, partial [Microgenomates group bacterium]